jgi:hypothetical protein
MQMDLRPPPPYAAQYFLLDEEGAVTVDWVVLSAAVIGLGMVVLGPIAFSADSQSVKIGDNIGKTAVGYDK